MTTNTRAQIPGYCGYIPGKYSENKFGSTFGQVTKGSYGTQNQAFLTTNIANNTFIQRQHEDSNQFWGDNAKVTTFEKPTRSPKKHNQRIDAKKYIPEQKTSMTYEQAVSKLY